jgi:SAM-dependent methyltransferase
MNAFSGSAPNVRAPSATFCPACGSNNFGPTNEVLDIDRLMKRWSDHGVAFNAETLNRYSSERLGPIRLYQCRSCGFGQYLPIVVGDSDFYAAIGRLEYYTEEKWEFSHSLRLIRNENACSVIDVGCGSGLFLDQLRAAMPSIKATGLEINELAAAQARSRGHHVEILDWSDDNFTIDSVPKADLVVCHQVLEHVRDPVRFLQAIRAMVTDKGLAIISTPDSAGLVGTQTDSLTEQPPHHVTKWTEQAFRAALPRAAFRSIHAYYEPLPKILWPGYFPKIWEANGWPALLGRTAAHFGNLNGEGMNWVSDIFEKKGISYIYGAGGHTVLVTARPFTDNGALSDTSVDKDHRNGPPWLSRLSDRIAKLRSARRITARKRAFDRAFKGLIASVERFNQEIDTANAEMAKGHGGNSMPDEPLRFTSAIMELLAATVLAANRDYEMMNRFHEDRAFLKGRDIPCETGSSETTEIDPDHHR